MQRCRTGAHLMLREFVLAVLAEDGRLAVAKALLRLLAVLLLLLMCVREPSSVTTTRVVADGAERLREVYIDNYLVSADVVAREGSM